MALPEDRLLAAVASALADNLGASLQEIADAAGVGRTTLHRRFPTRQALTDAVVQHALRDYKRVMDSCGVDDLSVAEVLQRLAKELTALAVAYELIYAQPPIATLTDQQTGMAQAQGVRFEKFVERGQVAGSFRSDVPSSWIHLSIGMQAVAIWYALRGGVIAPRESERLFLTTVLDGLRSAPGHAPEHGHALEHEGASA